MSEGVAYMAITVFTLTVFTLKNFCSHWLTGILHVHAHFLWRHTLAAKHELHVNKHSILFKPLYSPHS